MQNMEFRTLDSMDVEDVLLPSQYFDAIRGGALCSEQRLILAVLVDAINVLRSEPDGRRAQTPCFHRSGEVGAHEGKSLPVLVRQRVRRAKHRAGNAA